MSSPEVKAKNTRAIAAMRSKDYSKAIDAYTDALRLEGNDGKYYHKILSNRSNAYFRDGQYRLALKDAESAVDIDSSFYTAHVRKADALRALKRFPEAIKAYDAALACDTVQKKADIEAKKSACIVEKDGGDASSSSANGSSSTTDNKASSSSSSPSDRPSLPLSAQLELMLHLVVITTIILYVVKTQAYYWSIKAGILVNSLLLYRKSVRQPEFKNMAGYSFGSIWGAVKSWFPREFISSSQIMSFFPAVVLLISRPSFIGVLPLVGRSVLRLPALLERQPAFISNLAKPLVSKIKDKKQQLVMGIAQLEIFTGFALILTALAGGGSFLAVMMYWQFLRMSYMIARHPYAVQYSWAQNVTSVWNLLAYKVDGWVLGPSAVPSVIKTAYTTMKGFLNRMTDPQAATNASRGGGMSSLLNSCSVM